MLLHAHPNQGGGRNLVVTITEAEEKREVDVRWWGQKRMVTVSDKHDNENVVIRDSRGKDTEKWGCKLLTVSHLAEQQRRIWWIHLHRPAHDIGCGIKIIETLSWLDYRTRDCSGGSRQWQQLTSAMERGKRWDLLQRKVIKSIRQSWHHSMWIPANYTVTLRLLCSLALSVPCWFFMYVSFLRNTKPENPRK